MLILANHPDRQSPQEIEALTLEIQEEKNRKRLKLLIDQLLTAINGQQKIFRIVASRSDLNRLVEWTRESIEPGQAAFVPYGMISRCLSYYEPHKIRPHARISVDPNCVWRHVPHDFEIRMLETSLYEDMCLLWNMTSHANSDIPRWKSTAGLDYKIPAKRHVALMRATVLAAFYFVESYINGVAEDFLYANEGRIADKDKALLKEWDAVKGQRISVSTKNKIIKYTRIVTGAPGPPLDERNCPELSYFATTAKEIRDSIVHASASFDPNKPFPGKEKVFMRLNQGEVSKIVDSSIVLVGKVETLVYGEIPPWLYSRGPNGIFEDQVFT